MVGSEGLAAGCSMNLPRPTLAIGLLVWSLPVLAQPALTDAPQQQEQAATRAQPDYREQLLAYELGAITVVEDESGLRALDSAGRTLDAGPLSLALGDTSSFDAHRQRARRIRRLSATARIAGGALVLTGYGLAQVTNFDPLAGPYDGLGLAVPVSLLAGGDCSCAASLAVGGRRGTTTASTPGMSRQACGSRSRRTTSRCSPRPWPR